MHNSLTPAHGFNVACIAHGEPLNAGSDLRNCLLISERAQPLIKFISLLNLKT